MTVAVLLAAAALIVLVVFTERMARRAPLDRLVWGVLGGFVGLVAGMIVGVALGALVAPVMGQPMAASSVGVGAPVQVVVARAVRAAMVLVGLYLGAAIGVRRGPELTGINAWLFRRDASGQATKLLDTSAIIDGRIADLAATGFIDGPLVVPQFVLAELQRVADATDPRRRSRGKRGFEVLQRLQRLPGALTQIADIDAPGVKSVDEKLLEIAKSRGARIVTTDYNLNQRADLSGVTVLNVNDLANALKPAVVAGEPMHVHVLREGKEAGQGVAYLDDGTMVVIEQGKRWIGQSVDVAVTSVLQTPSGRIIFTRVREEEATRA